MLKIVWVESFTIQLALLHVFNVKVKNLAFDTSQMHGFIWITVTLGYASV